MVARRRTITPLSYRKGTSASFAWPITEAGAPVNLTGWTVRAQIREYKGSPNVLYEFTTANGGVTTTNGQVALQLTPAISAAWTFREAVYDVLLIDPAGKTMLVSEGLFTLRAGVTSA
jgi:hypothetical protein